MSTALIFGATSKIAQEVARNWASCGWSLLLVGRDPKRLETLKGDLLAVGSPRVEVFNLDLNNIDQFEPLIAEIWRKHIQIEVALLAHGVLGDPSVSHEKPTETARILNSNFVSHAALLTALKAPFVKQGSGAICVLSSVAGDRGRRSNYVYGSAKGGVNKFLQGLRAELFEKNVRVISILLGPVDTPMTAEMKNLPFVIDPVAAANSIVRRIAGRGDVFYIPRIWRPIMFIIRALPELIAKRLNL